jgi:hypothetical protein
MNADEPASRQSEDEIARLRREVRELAQAYVDALPDPRRAAEAQQLERRLQDTLDRIVDLMPRDTAAEP